MAHIPDERFKGTLYDVEDCLDAITDDEVVKPSEKKKAVKMFSMFLDFCKEEKIIPSYTLDPLKFRLGLEVVEGPAGLQVVVPTTAKELKDKGAKTMNDKKENKPYEHCESCEYKDNQCKVYDKFQRLPRAEGGLGLCIKIGGRGN